LLYKVIKYYSANDAKILSLTDPFQFLINDPRNTPPKGAEIITRKGIDLTISFPIK